MQLIFHILYVLDSPTKVKTDAIIAQLKSVGVDAGGVKSLKDLKEEKKLAQYRKEEEVFLLNTNS